MTMEHKCYCRGDDITSLELSKPDHLLPMLRPFSMRLTNMETILKNMFTCGVLTDYLYNGDGRLLVGLWKTTARITDFVHVWKHVPRDGACHRLLNYIYLHLSEVQYLLCLHVMLCQCCARNPSLSSLNEAVEIRVESQAEIEESSARIVSFNKMPLQLTKPAPQFKATAVVNGEFKEVALSDYKGKYVVLFFYPLDFTFVCPTEIIAFSESADDFRKIGCELIAASTDSHFTHLAWINTPRKQGGLGPMNIPLISDKSHNISRDYGVLNEETGVPFRGLFIIDDKQNLRQITVNDLPVGRSVEETLRLVQAFQFTDEHGEVCPANWRPGSKTIKPDTKAAQEYFLDAN